MEIKIERNRGRAYSIPNELLYGITLRGRSKWLQNNVIELNDVEQYLSGCPYWEEIAEIAPSMYKEDFYDTYFPNGLPQEWSDAEKEKSHGGGVLGPSEKVTIWKYSRNFMTGIPRFAWNTTNAVNEYLKTVEADSIESLISLYVKPTHLLIEQLKPVKKILRPDS
jgi:hypothetical protein